MAEHWEVFCLLPEFDQAEMAMFRDVVAEFAPEIDVQPYGPKSNCKFSVSKHLVDPWKYHAILQLMQFSTYPQWKSCGVWWSEWKITEALFKPTLNTLEMRKGSQRDVTFSLTWDGICSRFVSRFVAGPGGLGRRPRRRSNPFCHARLVFSHHQGLLHYLESG